jgi:hypothetical protein
MTRKHLRAIVAAVLILGFVGVPISYGCWDLSAPNTTVALAQSSWKVQSVDVSPDSLVLDIGDQGLVACRVYNRPGKTGSLLTNACNWKSWDTTVVAVVSSGAQSATVTARKVGKTWVVAGVSGKRDSILARVVTAYTPLKEDSVRTVPASWNATDSAWKAFGIYFGDSTGGLYGKDTVKLSWTCPAGGASKCPSQQFCPIAYFSDGVAGLSAPYRSRTFCVAEYAKLPAAQRALTPAHTAILDTLCTMWIDDGQKAIGHEACDGGPSGVPGLAVARLP